MWNIVNAIVAGVAFVALALAVWLWRYARGLGGEVDGLAEMQRALDRELGDRERQIQKLSARLAEVERRPKREDKDPAVARLESELRALKQALASAPASQQAAPPAPSRDAAGLAALGSRQIQQIYELLDEGRSSADIARLKGVQVGEVELVRGLKQLAARDAARS